LTKLYYFLLMCLCRLFLQTSIDNKINVDFLAAVVTTNTAAKVVVICI